MLTDRGRLPGDGASAWEWLLFEQSGIVTTRQAEAHLGRPRVRHLVQRGTWRSICRGVIAAQAGPLTRPQHLWVAVLAAGKSGVLGGLAAAIDGGLRRMRSERIDILVPPGSTYPDLLRRLPPDLPAVFVHRTATLPKEHVQAGTPARTTMPRSLVDAAGWARTGDEARRILAMGCQQRLATADELLAVAGQLPRIRRHRLIVETAADLAGGAEALSEIDVVRLCRRAKLPAPDLQERRVDAAGRTRYLDVYWRHWKLHVEVDGAHHMDAAQWQADMVRQNHVWIAGDRVLRFSAFQVRHRADEVTAHLRAALTAAGWSG